MKIYNIKNSVKGVSVPVKVLFETKHMILHRPARKDGLNDTCRNYVITLKDVPNLGYGEDTLNDLRIIGSFEKIKDNKTIMQTMEHHFDLSDTAALTVNKDFKDLIFDFRDNGLSNLRKAV